jgi:hypothetical protein
MPTDDLYQPCHWCDEPHRPKRADGTCLSCGGAKFFRIGLTVGQVDGLVARARRFYRADGTYEELHSERAVIERRKEAAREIERLEAENLRLARLNDDKFAHLQGYCKAADEDRATIVRLQQALCRIVMAAIDDIARGSHRDESYIREIEADARAALANSDGELMMRKRDELTNPGACMVRARDDEMTFVLLGRDVAAPVAIRAWIAERVRTGKNRPDDPQVVEAEQCARVMEREADAHAT